jgi:hypothetical protein
MDEKHAFNEALSLSGKQLDSLSNRSSADDIETIRKWHGHSGKKWVTSRLKSLKAFSLHILSGTVDYAPEYVGRKTTYKGRVIPALRMFSTLVDFCESNNWKGIRSVLDVFNTYMIFTSPVDNIQEKIDIITRKPSKEPNDGYSASLKADIVGLFTNRDFPLTKRRRPFELKFNGPDLGGSRYAEGPGKNSSCLPALIPSLELPQWVYDDVPNLRDWVRSHPYFKKIHYMSKLFGNGVKERGPYWAGNLAFLSEPGLKTRVVFVGNPWIQGALRSSMVILQRELLKLSTDCTFDQDRGRSFLREGLSEGKTMHSIDLSQATDNFPFSLQESRG